ncbi:hypothetical protein SISNIDRAFT_420989 [Sistotremastrum niveocremeum HHB9708]|uniref:Uncharacterized protein n=1 Tax=Sistotremastrum niveocremeum HHB9708 TaxID=1314777 RepID=A0A164M5C2_9AGAM|nr:hypothetical protein SISNIDRAFT_420989 [Sistotremastrum niveocremeum HHB9708]
MAHGVEPTLPLDITESTFLGPSFRRQTTLNELIGIRARQLQKRPDDLAKMHEQVLKRRHMSALQYSRRFHSSLRTFDFTRGMVVLARNIIIDYLSITIIDKGIGNKTEPRYIGPYLVIRKTVGGAYVLAELTGAILSTRFSANRLVPLYSRRSKSPDDILIIPITQTFEPNTEFIEHDTAFQDLEPLFDGDLTEDSSDLSEEGM